MHLYLHHELTETNNLNKADEWVNTKRRLRGLHSRITVKRVVIYDPAPAAC